MRIATDSLNLAAVLRQPTPSPTGIDSAPPPGSVDLGGQADAMVVALVVGILLLAGLLGWALGHRRG